MHNRGEPSCLVAITTGADQGVTLCDIRFCCSRHSNYFFMISCLCGGIDIVIDNIGAAKTGARQIKSV